MGVALAVRRDIPAVELRRLARHEADGQVASRLLAIANVLDGMDRATAARAAEMDRQTLRDWVIRFNDQGVDGLHDLPRSGRSARLSDGQQATLKAIVLRGPNPERDGVSARRAIDLCRVVGSTYTSDCFGVPHRGGGMVRLLHALDLSWQKTRPRHPNADPMARQRFKKGALPSP